MSVITRLPRKLARPRPTTANTPWKWSVAEYFAMIDAGILASDAPVELLEGEIVPKMSKNHPHRYAKRLLRRAVERMLGGNYFLDEQEPIIAAESAPEPDLAVIRGSDEMIKDRHPSANETPLIIEIADSSVGSDRGRKQKIYARAGIPIYWVVNLPARHIEVYSDPIKGRNPRYESCNIFRPGDLVPVVVDRKEIGRIKVSDLFPKKS